MDADNPGVQIIHRGKYKSLSAHERRLLRRRQAIEPLIGHTKADHRMDRCWLQGAVGDALHALSCAAGYNRLAIYGFVAAVFAITPYLPGRHLGTLLASLILLALVGQSLSRYRVYRFWAPVYEAAIEAGALRPGASFAGSGLIERGDATYTRRVRVGFQVEQIAAISARGAAVTSTLPSVKYGYFPLRYRPERDFFRTMPRWSWGLNFPEAPFKAYRAENHGIPRVLIATGSIERTRPLATRLGLRSCYFEHSGPVGLLACEEAKSDTDVSGSAP